MVTEFVGTNRLGDTIGLVIANIDSQLKEKMNIGTRYNSIGIVGARTGAGPHIFAADEAVKSTNSEILSIELPRDTKGGGGHGSLIIFGADDVSDVRKAVEICLADLERTFGDVYSARASQALVKGLGAEKGKAFGITVASPAAIGVILADTAVKAAAVEVRAYSSPGHGTSYSNEVILGISGDSGAVKQAIISAREVGIELLAAMGDRPESTTKPYIL